MNGTPILELRKFNTPEFVLGTGASGLVGSYAARFGATRILLVSDSALLETGHVAAVARSLRSESLDTVLFTDISPNPRDFQVRAGCELYRGEKCDAIVAVGGGSVIDAAKGIGLMVTNAGDVLDFEGIDMVPLPGPPLICIPTTAGTAADISQFAVINAVTKGTKIIIVSKKAIADIALVDPELCVTMNPELTAATGMDALTHAIEAYVSTASSPLTDLQAIRAVALVSEFLPRAVRDGEDREARNGMTLASLLAGLAFSNASLGAVHSLAHPLGAQLDLPHGLCNALLLESVIRFNYELVAARYSYMARLFESGIRRRTTPDVPLPLDGGLGLRSCDAVVGMIHDMREEVGLGSGLSGHGLTRERIPALARMAYVDGCLATNPRKPTVAELEALYVQAL